MNTHFTRDEAIRLLMEHNKEAFHIQHGLTVGKVMRYYAEKAGFADEADFWEIVGILHDLDYEEFPEEHVKACIPMLEAAGAEQDLIYSVCSHCWGHMPWADCEPVHQMQKFIYAADELTGLVGAAALMRPSKSCTDMELSSLKKKFKDKKFAAGCSRDVIKQGAELLGWELDQLLDEVLEAMKASEADIDAELKALTA